MTKGTLVYNGISTCLIGRRMYETMSFWETPTPEVAASEVRP